MAKMKCKCGGMYDKMPEGNDTTYNTYSCPMCGNTWKRKKSYKGRPKTKKPEKLELSYVQTGKAVAEYLMYLELEVHKLAKEIKELKPLANERDKLKEQIAKMQEKYNAASMNGTVKIPKLY